MNKKAIGLLVVLGLTATLAACGGGGTAESPAASPDAMSPSASPTTSP
jgi:predicted small lipoprotein YifL